MSQPVLAPIDEAVLAEYIEAMPTEFAPRRFAIFGVAPDRSDAGVLGWGLDFEGAAVFCYENGGEELSRQIHGSSAEQVRQLLARRGEVRLGWADPLPAASPDVPESPV